MMGARRMPAAEVDVTPDLVRRLLAAQQPDLADLPVEDMAHGWDNVMCRIGGELVARLPRLPLPIPAPVRIGRPGLGYPWPWSIVPFVPGQVAARNPPADPPAAAVSLGRFLAALHAPAAPDAPVSPFRGVPLADRAATVAENLSIVAGRVDRRAVLRVWQAALAAPRWDSAPVWLHGDLHPANILVHRGRLSGVIDFGDITSGDPATDLSAAWMLLPAGYHPAFRDAYRAAAQHPAGDDMWARARGWALALSLVFLAHSADNPLLAEVGR